MSKKLAQLLILCLIIGIGLSTGTLIANPPEYQYLWVLQIAAISFYVIAIIAIIKSIKEKK